jgi:hypothetical protein
MQRPRGAVLEDAYCVIDAVLPLAQRPTVLVRVAAGKPTWQLKVLGPNGITTHAVPVPGSVVACACGVVRAVRLH